MTPRVSLMILSDRPKVLPVLLHALVNQTFEHWEAFVLDQGEGRSWPAVEAMRDSRLLHRTVPHVGDWGQTVKAATARALAQGDIFGFPNDDAYYCPVFLAQMVAAIDAGAELVYCDWVFDKPGYAPYPGRPQVGWVDVGGFLITRRAFTQVGWDDTGNVGDGLLVERAVAAGLPHARVPGVFYVKN